MSTLSLEADRAAAKADACPLCSATRARPIEHVPSESHADYLPWAMVLTAAAVVTAIGLGPERWFGFGAMSGLLAGVACAWVSVRAVRRGRTAAHALELKALSEDADMRVQGVIKQFEWAVNDVVKLKRDVDRAETAADALVERARERERYVQKLERQLFDTRERLTQIVVPSAEPTPPPAPQIDGSHVPFHWGLHLDGRRAVLELETGYTLHRPTRVRIVDRDGQVIAVSGTAMVGESGGSGFTIDGPPADLIADLDARRDPNYAIEALVQHEWKPARMEDTGRRTRIVEDKQGRTYRVADAADAAQVLASPPRTDLN
jgi:hypothetical protein